MPVPTNQGTSEDTKTIVTVLLLIFIYPIGVIVMWFWTSWPKWVKWLVSLVFLFFMLGIVAIFASVVLVAVNPAGQFAKANNTVRREDVGTILIAIDHYKQDHNGQLPPGLPAQSVTSFPIESAIGTGASFCNALVPAYLPKLPVDPIKGLFTACNSYDTQYTISVSSTSRVTISAPNSQLGLSITVTK